MPVLHTPTYSNQTFRPARLNRIVGDVITLGLYDRWYRRTTYGVADADLVIERGLRSPRKIRIPVSDIDRIRMYLSPIPGTSTVTIKTGKSVVAAPFLTRNDARSLAVSLRELKWEHERGTIARANRAGLTS